jgi:signal transduction histidine kinase/CheY-like chemotaxis protein
MGKQFFSKNVMLMLFVFSFIVVLVLSVSTTSFTTFLARTMEYNTEQRLIAVSKAAARLVSARELDQYRSVEDMSLPAYRALRYRLLDFSREYDVFYVYYVRLSGEDKLQYIIDNDFDESTRVGMDTLPYPLNPEPWIGLSLEGETVCSGLGNYTPGWEGLLSAYSPVFDQDGNVAAIAGVDIRDEPIVRAKRMVDILTGVRVFSVVAVFMSAMICLVRFLQEAKKATEASEAKSHFLSRVSHEIRTPLNAIIGMGELALRSGTLPQMIEHVSGIKRAGQSLLALVNDLLDFSKIEAKSLEINLSPYFLASLLNDVINVARVRAAEKSLLFMVNVEANLPARLLGDAVRVRQILFNLLSNAVKYTHQGFVRLRVFEADGAAGGDGLFLVMEVSDSGIGIKAEDKKNIFGDFVRLDLDQNKSIEGTGLGLAITRSLCQLMGGGIHLESEYGKGSVFRVTIPQGRLGAAAGAQIGRGSALESEKLAVVENPKSKAVILYDHRSGYAESLMETLRNFGVPAIAAATAEELLEQLARGRFSFAFVSTPALEQAASLIREESLNTVLVLLAEISATTAAENASGIAGIVIPMPAYAVSVANALNGKHNTRHWEDSIPGFIVPKARLLIVDDLATNIKVTEGLLALYQAEVDTCLSGDRAVEMVKEREYDIVFMDHMMPVMDGIEATAAIRAWEKERKNQSSSARVPVPILALTANATAGIKGVFLENGFNDFLPKPIDLAKLDDIMNVWIPAEKKVPVAHNAAVKANAKESVKPGPGDGISVEGIDIAAGFEHYHDAYPEILRSYYNDTVALLEKLRNIPEGNFSEDRLREYATAVHGIKGSSYGIFANGMGRLAEFMEHTARAGDAQTVQAQNGRFIKTTETLLSSLEELLEKVSPKTPRQKASVPDQALLQKIAEACARYQAKEMEEALAGLEQYEYESGGELVQWLRKQADNLEYDAIRERLASAAARNGTPKS